MQIQSTQEALYIACEMERGAVQLYERAIRMMEELGRSTESLCVILRAMLADERRHLREFQVMYTGLDMEVEQRLMLSAIAHGVLFEGGLMGAVRSGMLSSIRDMLRYAENAEVEAVKTYRLFASQAEDMETRKMLLSIADEESTHIDDIQKLWNEATGY